MTSASFEQSSSMRVLGTLGQPSRARRLGHGRERPLKTASRWPDATNCGICFTRRHPYPPQHLRPAAATYGTGH